MPRPCKPGKSLACTLAWFTALARRAGKGTGHGYKFCSVVGEIIADLATGDGTTQHDIGFLGLSRPALMGGVVEA